jgi:hypothetical protein
VFLGLARAAVQFVRRLVPDVDVDLAPARAQHVRRAVDALRGDAREDAEPGARAFAVTTPTPRAPSEGDA